MRLDAVGDSLGARQAGGGGIPDRPSLHRAPAGPVAQRHPLLRPIADAIHQLDGAQPEVVAGRVANLDRPRRGQLQPIGGPQDLDARRGVGLGGQAMAALLADRPAERRLQPKPIAPVLQ